jgi:hypothetical protein
VRVLNVKILGMTPDERAQLIEDINRSANIRVGIVEQARISKEFDIAAAWQELEELDATINKRVVKARSEDWRGIVFGKPHRTELERQWDDLMFLCQREKEYLAEQTHRVLVKVLTHRIDELARQTGFNEAQIQNRNFRAEKSEGPKRRVDSDFAA